MGAKQSSPTANPAANGRTRAYSGSDLPSSTSGSSAGRTAARGARYHGASGASGPSTSQQIGARARSVGGSSLRPHSGINIPNSGGGYSSPESGGSSPEEAADRERSGGGQEVPRLLIGSLPAHLSPHLFGGKSAEPLRCCGDADARLFTAGYSGEVRTGGSGNQTGFIDC